MYTVKLLYLISIPALAVFLTVNGTKAEEMPQRLLKFLGVLVSSIPLIGVIQGFIARKKSPQYAKACFIQAIYCGLGFLLIAEVLPLLT